MPHRTLISLQVLTTGYALGVLVAGVLTLIAAVSRWGNDALGLTRSDC